MLLKQTRYFAAHRDKRLEFEACSIKTLNSSEVNDTTSIRQASIGKVSIRQPSVSQVSQLVKYVDSSSRKGIRQFVK